MRVKDKAKTEIDESFSVGFIFSCERQVGNMSASILVNTAVITHKQNFTGLLNFNKKFIF